MICFLIAVFLGMLTAWYFVKPPAILTDVKNTALDTWPVLKRFARKDVA